MYREFNAVCYRICRARFVRPITCSILALAAGENRSKKTAMEKVPCTVMIGLQTPYTGSSAPWLMVQTTPRRTIRLTSRLTVERRNVVSGLG
uniref:Uncharacterized protein n=1 Tax=Anopheles funestus TaxID=62324 RepID=A0A182S1B0_ANOFN